MINSRCSFAYLVVLVASLASLSDAFSNSFADGLKTRAKAKLIEKVESGASNDEVLKAVREVEKFSVLGGTDLKNPQLQGNWLMIWTTSSTTAGKTRPTIFQPNLPPEQLIDVHNSKAVNAEKILGIRNAVRSEIAPLTKNRVKVQFKEFSVGPISYKADEEKWLGELAVSYLDDDMRISRSHLDNNFVLLRESTHREEANRIWKEWKKSWE